MRFKNSDSFDEYLKKRAEAEQIVIPSAVREKIELALAKLPETEKDTKRKDAKLHVSLPLRRFAAAAACLVFLTLFLLPNISVNYAEAMEKIPVIGKIVKVVTIRNYFYSDENHKMDIKVPEIKEDGSEASVHINKDVDQMTSELMEQFYKDIEIAGGHGSLSVEYETVTDTESWFTLKLSVEETVGSSGKYFRYYHIDKRSGSIVQLGDMFTGESYQKILTEEIKKQMKERMEEDKTVVYWAEKDEFGIEFVKISGDRNFYWNKDGNLVIAFDKYEVGPGSSGEPEFVIEWDLIENILKPEYSAIVS